jgi:hypothetical protein
MRCVHEAEETKERLFEFAGVAQTALFARSGTACRAPTAEKSEKNEAAMIAKD